MAGKTVASGWQDYTVTCDPKVTAGLKPAENLAVGVHVVQSSLAVTPQAGLTGKCGVELRGSVRTNVAHAKVKLAYRNHKGVMTSPREVMTGLDKRAVFTDHLDFSKKAGGMWIDQTGARIPTVGATPASTRDRSRSSGRASSSSRTRHRTASSA